MPPHLVRFGRAETALGPMWVAETDRGLAASSRSPSLDGFVGALRRRFAGWTIEADIVGADWVDDAVTGGPLPAVDLHGIAGFDAAVYEVVRGIPPGETMTYGEVAAALGSPAAARAVGNAMARCPLFPAVPCQRVVRASDGWSGWGGDPALKRRLLLAERRGTQGT